MIKGTFEFASDRIDVIVDGNILLFCDSNGMATTIEGLKLDKPGVIKEFPDLKDDDEWRQKAIERLKTHLKTMETDAEKLNYVRDELKKFGWTPLFKQRAGWRPERWD